jgi:hypothetical protein
VAREVVAKGFAVILKFVADGGQENSDVHDFEFATAIVAI